MQFVRGEMCQRGGPAGLGQRIVEGHNALFAQGFQISLIVPPVNEVAEIVTRRAVRQVVVRGADQCHAAMQARAIGQPAGLAEQQVP